MPGTRGRWYAGNRARWYAGNPGGAGTRGTGGLFHDRAQSDVHPHGAGGIVVGAG
jgi:hypothetical protein